TVAIRGEINSTLYDAFDHGGAILPPASRAELAWNVADVFEYRLDMSRDLQPGDHFQVLFERSRGPESTVRIGRILVAEYKSGATVIDATRFEDGDGKARFFDQEGKSMRAMFLRAPLEFRRISSIFGLRKHPILGIWRAHKGTDYAASSGTPVRSIGDGVIVHAGRMNGYGNVIDVRHANGFVSRYGHLRGFASGIRPGARVGIAQTIGVVGMTGLATRPHLHFEVLVRGVQQNPPVALAAKGGEPLASAHRAAFEERRTQYLALMQRASALVGGSN
ncbi:MAG: M23 family metallopeptidase, partial [Gemmatimonadaceae bacterium]